MQEIRKVRKDKEAYMQDVPEATHHDNTSADSVKSIVKISECYRTPVKCEQRKGCSKKIKITSSYGL